MADSIPSLPVLALLANLGYLTSLAVYRLYLSSLAKFPGPKLAASTKWYEAYYEIVLNGKFSFHIEDLHRQYGPIVRITPFEVHIQDPPFWDTLYVKLNRTAKYEWTAGRFGNTITVFITCDPTEHKIRRAPLNHMFSRKAILKLEPMVRKKLEILCRGLEKFHETGSVCNIGEAFSAFAGDVVTKCCFEYNYDHSSLDGFTNSFHDAFMAVSAFSHVALQFPWMHSVSCVKMPGEPVSLADQYDLVARQVTRELERCDEPAIGHAAHFAEARSKTHHASTTSLIEQDLGAKIISERTKVEQGAKTPDYPPSSTLY